MSRFLVVQIVKDASPHMEEVKANFLTRDGVLIAATCDGYYDTQKAAEGVAEYLSGKHPNLQTYVVQIVATMGQQA